MNHVDAIKKVLEHEGGFVNHPADKGGPTNFGITKAVYEGYLKRPVTIAEMQNMPLAHAIEIYKKSYWDVVRGDEIKSYAIAFMLFDQAVNRGPAAAIRQAQAVMGLSQDGKLGPLTLKALNDTDEHLFRAKYLEKSAEAYRAIASNNPSQSVFLAGWLNRVASLEEYAKSVSGAASIAGILILAGLVFFLILQKPSKGTA